MARVNVPYRHWYNYVGGLNNGRILESAGIYAAQTLYDQYNKGTFKGLLSSGSEKGMAPSGVLTSDYDVGTTYRRRRGNRRRVRRWIRFSKKVQRVARDDLPTQVAFRTTSATVATVAAANTQNHVSFALYGSSGTVGMFDDLSAIYTDALNVAPAGTVTAALEMFWKSATMDITMRNTSVANTAKVDIYTVAFKDDIDVAAYTTLSNLFSNSITSYPTMGGTTTAINAATRGVTPFMAPMFGTLATILSVKSYLLGLGEVGTFKFSSKKHFTLTGEEAGGMMALRKCTVGFLIVVYAADASSTGVTSINVTAERKYFFVNQFADKVTISGT